MAQRLLLVADSSFAVEGIENAQELCQAFAEFLGEQVGMVVVESKMMDAMRSSFSGNLDVHFIGAVGPSGTPKNAPMGSAPFIWRDDGRPDWGKMWEGFCELALFGGPPHRGDEAALRAEDGVPLDPDSEAIQEIRRGIWETTGLYSEPAEPGWMAIVCDSRKMAAWMAACIILENVDARFEDDRLLVPAATHYQLKDQIKSVITVVAKVNHYWQAHASKGGRAPLIF